jgi:hypothetical protein
MYHSNHTCRTLLSATMLGANFFRYTSDCHFRPISNVLPKRSRAYTGSSFGRNSRAAGVHPDPDTVERRKQIKN